MKNLVKKKWFPLALAVCALALLALGWYFANRGPDGIRTAGRSSHTGLPLEGYTAWTDREEYRAGATKLTVSVRNDRELFHEFDHPRLEIQQDGVWYYLYREEGAETADLYSIAPGTVGEFPLWTGRYDKLTPGHYRAVFGAWGSADYIAAEFDVT